MTPSLTARSAQTLRHGATVPLVIGPQMSVSGLTGPCLPTKTALRAVILPRLMPAIGTPTTPVGLVGPAVLGRPTMPVDATKLRPIVHVELALGLPLARPAVPVAMAIVAVAVEVGLTTVAVRFPANVEQAVPIELRTYVHAPNALGLSVAIRLAWRQLRAPRLPKAGLPFLADSRLTPLAGLSPAEGPVALATPRPRRPIPRLLPRAVPTLHARPKGGPHVAPSRIALPALTA